MIVLIETRAGWMVAPSKDLPLSRAYHFRPGVPQDVPDADFDLLCDCTLVEGRSFVPADADYAKPFIAAAPAPAPKDDAVAASEPTVTGVPPATFLATEPADAPPDEDVQPWRPPTVSPKDKPGAKGG